MVNLRGPKPKEPHGRTSGGTPGEPFVKSMGGQPGASPGRTPGGPPWETCWGPLRETLGEGDGLGRRGTKAGVVREENYALTRALEGTRRGFEMVYLSL